MLAYQFKIKSNPYFFPAFLYKTLKSAEEMALKEGIKNNYFTPFCFPFFSLSFLSFSSDRLTCKEVDLTIEVRK